MISPNVRTVRKRFRTSFCWTLYLWTAWTICTVRGGKEVSVTGLVGSHAQLPCDVDKASCGEVYFITWTKNVSNESKRVYLYSDSVNKPLQKLANPDRARFYLEDSTAYLKISPVKLEDEGAYKCDVTYVQGKCPSLSYANLITIAKPGLPVIKKDGINIQNASTVGPFYEGVSLAFECFSSGGKPTPTIGWWKSQEPLAGEDSTSQNGDVSTSVSLSLTREDVGKKLECRVQNEATGDVPLVTWIEFDVHVAPSSLEVIGPKQTVFAGSRTWLTCIIKGAKPAANATWYNASEVLEPQPLSRAEVMPDGTFQTTSILEILVSRYDNKANFYCKGTNFVLQSRGHPPLLKSTTMEVYYPPVVTILPAGGVIVNESNSITLTCSYLANPSNVSNLSWFKGRKLLDIKSNRRFTVIEEEFPKLRISNVSRSDMAFYFCSLSNVAGRGNTTNKVEVNVLYPPRVQATVSPGVVNEGSFTSVSLFCEILDGNPQNLQRVRWYKDDELMNETTEKEITWLNVGRNLTGKYYCEGENAAGWGNKSEPAGLVVNFSPSKAVLIHVDAPAIKGRSTKLDCYVEDLGYPPSTVYRWEANGHPIRVTSENYTIPRVTLETNGNYSCAAVNIVGSGEAGYLDLEVAAPPSFLERPPDKFGAAANADSISVLCRVECEPSCAIHWFKDGQSLEDSPLYTIKSTPHPAVEEEGHFESVVSTLNWNMSAWPEGQLSREKDNANYTCRSTANVVGPGVSMTAYFTVEYAPENLIISPERVDVAEGEVPEQIQCIASSWPLSQYYWTYGDDLISSQSTLFLNYSVPRGKSGTYTCVSHNTWGQATGKAFINVLYKPDCDIEASRNEDDDPILICEVHANPSQSEFLWFKNNETVTDGINNYASKSILTLEESNGHEDSDNPEDDDQYGVYYCLANNSVGFSKPCRFELVRPPGTMSRFSELDIIIIACAVAGIVLLFIIIIIIIILIMRRKRLSTGHKSDIGKREITDVRVEPPDTRPFTKSTFFDALQNGRSPIKVNPVLTFKRDDDHRRRRRSVSDSSSPAKIPTGEPLYQNVTGPEKKGNGPPPPGPNDPDNRAMYENMPFHFGQRGQKGPFRPDVSDDLLYADLYDDVKSGKVADPRLRPPLPPKGIGKEPKEPPLPPKMTKKGAAKNGDAAN